MFIVNAVSIMSQIKLHLFHFLYSRILEVAHSLFEIVYISNFIKV